MDIYKQLIVGKEKLGILLLFIFLFFSLDISSKTGKYKNFDQSFDLNNKEFLFSPYASDQVNNNYVEIPLGGNSFVTTKGGAESVKDAGFDSWSSNQAVFSTFFRVNTAGTLNLYLKYLALADGNVIDVNCKGQQFRVTLPRPRSGGDTIVYLGKIDRCEVGYVRVDFKGVTLKGTVFAKPSKLMVNGTATSNMNFVNDFSYYWGRRGPSVHIRYPLPAGKTIEWFYNEVTIPSGQDVVGSYFMTNGFGQGYFGIQVNSTTERRVLFSVWSPYNTDDPNSIPEAYRVKLVKKGEGVVTGEFGNEGSGGQSFYRYNWKAGTTYKFLTRIRPSANGYSEYTSYFYKPETGSWMLIAQFLRPMISTYYTEAHSFLENFRLETGHIERKGYYNNQWACTKEGEWIELTNGSFSVDNTGNKKARMDFKGGADASGFYLQNCGFFNDYTAPGGTFKRTATNNRPTIDFANLPGESDNGGGSSGGDGSGGGNTSGCDAPQWSSSKAYTAGEKVSYNGYSYLAAFWSQNKVPDSNYGQYGQPWKSREICTGTPSVNVAPTVSIISPVSGTVVRNPSIDVSATASDTDGTISKVEFYLNGVLKYTDINAPYSSSLESLTSGINTIAVKAYDNSGAIATANSTVTYAEIVAPPSNQLPTVSITNPVNGSTVSTTSVTVSANASDTDGSITKVEFYLNNALKSTNTTPPYSATLSTLVSGANTITVKAYDNSGAIATANSMVTYTAPTTGGGSTGEGGGDCQGVAAWTSNKVYNKDDKASENGIIYQANYWTQNNRPSVNNGSGKSWTAVSKCDGSIDNSIYGETIACSGKAILIWKSATTYDKAGTQVYHNGKIYSNKYWTQGNTPGTSDVWRLEGNCQ